MKLLDNYNEDDIMSKILLLYFAFQHGAIGVFFLLTKMDDLQSKSFEGMSKILPMSAWGALLVLSAVAFVVSAFQEQRLQYWCMIISGLAGAVPFSLLAMATIELSSAQANAINYVFISSIDIIVAILGGVALWLRRTS